MAKKPIAKMKCEDIQSHLTDYLSRELGPYLSDAVRAHLRHCETCQSAVEELDSTINLLKSSTSLKIPARLSDSSRRRMYRVYKHPILSWLDSNQPLIYALALIMVMTYLGIYLIVASQPEPYDPAKWREVQIGTWVGDGYTNYVEKPSMMEQDPPANNVITSTFWLILGVLGIMTVVLLVRWWLASRFRSLSDQRKDGTRGPPDDPTTS